MEANKIIYGKVKCTYAQLYDKQGRKVANLLSSYFADELVCYTQAKYLDSDEKYIPVMLTELSANELSNFKRNTAEFVGTVLYVKPCAIDFVGYVPEKKNNKMLWLAGAGALGLLLLFGKKDKKQ